MEEEKVVSLPSNKSIQFAHIYYNNTFPDYNAPIAMHCPD